MNELPDGYVICAQCKQRAFKAKSRRHLYCPECSQERDIERKRVWSQRNPQPHDPERQKAYREAKRERLVAAGAAASPSRGMAWGPSDPIDLEWIVRVAMPFDYTMSKNAIWRSVGAGHVVLRQESRTAREVLALRISQAMGARRPVQSRIWLDIMVEKPNQRGDAINVVDFVADAVKDAIGIDDRWFSIRRLDWAVVKTDPQLYVGIGQEVGAVPSQVCSYCGQVLPFEAFSVNRSTKSGRSRTCVPCSKASGRLKWAKTRAAAAADGD